MTDEPDLDSPDYAELVLATDVAGDQPAGAPVSRALVRRARGLLEGPAPARVRCQTRDYGTERHWRRGMGRNRDSSLVAAHVSVPPGETRTVRFAHQLVRAQLPQVLGDPGLAFPAGIRAPSGQWQQLVRDRMGRRRSRIAARGAGALGRAPRRDRCDSATRCTDRPCRCAVLDAAAANLSILKSPTALRLEDGTFYGWEGCHPAAGSCEGSCTHVWNYQQALPFLFPALERSMREADYAYNMDDRPAACSFRLQPAARHAATRPSGPCADGQFGGILKLYRDWKLSRRHGLAAPPVAGTPSGAIEYAWSPDNPDRWDPDQTGVLWGRQHHTLDMELFGPNSWLTGFYLGRAEGRRGDGRRARRPARRPTLYRVHLRARPRLGGRQPVQRRVLRPARSTWATARCSSRIAEAEVAAGLLGDGVEHLYWSPEHKQLKYQLGDGCLIDQALGQWHASPVWPWRRPRSRSRSRPACSAIYRLQLQATARTTSYNPCRVFGLYDEVRHRHRQLAGRRRASRRCPCPTPRRRCTAWSTRSGRC